MEQIEKAKPSTDMFVFAKDSVQMAKAQQRVIDGMQVKRRTEATRLAELEDNLAIAKKNKWRTDTLRRHVGYAKERVKFYEKVVAALEAGYQIIPDMALDIFAIRTTRSSPLPGEKTGTASWGGPSLDSIKTDRPPVGEGEYVSPDRGVVQRDEFEKADKDGKPVKMVTKYWDGFAEPEFPFQLAKTEILEMTAEAMSKKIFDELGVLPRRPKSDPIVAGTIVLKGSGPYTTRKVNFMVAWFLDLNDI